MEGITHLIMTRPEDVMITAGPTVSCRFIAGNTEVTWESLMAR